MTLKERREQWELGGDVVLLVTKDNTYVVVHVVLRFEKKGLPTVYSMHRYFKIGDNWECSCDERGDNLEHCLSRVSANFRHLYPKDDEKIEINP